MKYAYAVSFPGREKYEELYPNGIAFNLNQNPSARAKRSTDVLGTLTTGCSHTWLKRKRRYLTGVECLALHSIPVTQQIASAMHCTRVNVDSISHAGCCFLAGNSMHAASVGAIVALGLLCTSVD